MLKKIFILLLITSFLASGFLILIPKQTQAAGPTYIWNHIDTPTVWTRANSPYILEAGFSIRTRHVNSQLIIEDGVVIKFKPDKHNGRYGGLQINGHNGGQIIIQNTSGNNLPVIFTSYYDNQHDQTHGTDADPQPNDWLGLIFYNDTSVLDNIFVAYGKNNLEFRDNSTTQVKNSTLENGYYRSVLVDNHAAPILDNLIIQNNTDRAMALGSLANAGELKNSVIQNNTGGDIIEMHANSLFQFNNNTFLNNTNSGVRLHGTIERDVILQNFNLPYSVVDSIQVNAGATLTIQPGVILKFADGGYGNYRLNIKGGNLNALGTPAEPIIFTSWRDDNNPQPSDWGDITFEDSPNSILEHVHIKYAGEYHGNFTGAMYATNHYDSIFIDNSSVAISNSIIEHGGQVGILSKNNSNLNLTHSQINNHQVGIDLLGEQGLNLNLKDNQIYSNSTAGLRYSDASQIDATQNWWGDDSGPTDPANPSGTGDAIQGNILYDPWIGKQPEIHPVILIPGIMGSWNVTGTWELDPIFHTYDNLWQALKNAGYQEGVDLFAFPYQWRVSNESTAHDLKNKIDEVQQITGASKVDLVAHSMGGLVARYYIENELFLQDNDGIDQVDVDQIIFLGTPHLGATKSYLTWEGGEVGPTVTDWFMKRAFSIEAGFNGYGSVFQYMRELPMSSVQELLPVYDYLKDADTGILRNYPNNYPINNFLQELNSFENLNKMNLVRGLNIIGKMGNDSTINIIRVEENMGADGEWEHGYPENYSSIFGDRGLEYNEGDETVPNRSNNQFLDWESVEFNSATHRQIVTEAQKIIIKELTGIEPTEMIKENIFSKFLLIKIHSPADFQIIDPNGNMLGKDFVNNLSLNQIPHAFYSGFNGPEFALIPNPLDGEYQINLMGTDNGGDYELIVSTFDQEIQTGNDSSTTNTIQAGENINYTLDYDSSSTEPFEIQEVVNSITINDIINHVKEIRDNNSFKNKWQANFLLVQLKIIKRWDKKFNNTKRAWLQRIYKKLILKKIKLMRRQLNRWLRKNKINQESYNILINDLNLLILNYQE